MKNFKTAFDSLLDKIKNKENFAFTRFSDGELAIMKNKYVLLAENHFMEGNYRGPGRYTKEEHKEFIPEKHQVHRELLLESYLFNEKNYFKGICTSSDPHVGNENFKWMVDLHGGDHENLTFSNLLINSNYSRFVEEMIPLFQDREIIYIVNENATTDNLPFEIKKKFEIGSNCMVNNFNTPALVKEYIEENDIKNHIVLCSAASLSNFVIYECYRNNQENTFLDIGSCLNPLLNLEGWKYTRGYLTSYWMNSNSPFGRQVDVWK
jgi:hypothetical protein